MEILLSSMYKLHFNSEAANASRKHPVEVHQACTYTEGARYHNSVNLIKHTLYVSA